MLWIGPWHVAIGGTEPGEPTLGVSDRGLWPDLDDRIQLDLPRGLTPDRVRAVVDAGHHLLILEVDGWPTKPYPLGGPALLVVDPSPAEGATTLALRPGDRAELAPLLTRHNVVELAARGPGFGDLDRDGIPDPLDALIGAKKTVVNADAYRSGYITIRYPMGDVPREIGVCTDVIVRALRNLGLDLQVEVHRDIARAPRAYPMVKGRGDPNIDHRRVRTILPWFTRHWNRRAAAPGNLTSGRSPAAPKARDPKGRRQYAAEPQPADPYRPGDIVFMDTFPSRSGPDHIGIISDRQGPSGFPLVINNWTDGTVTEEMDLLGWVPVTHRFRPPAR